MHAAEAEFVMQVRAGRETGRTDESDHIALADARAGPVLAETRHMPVQGGYVAGVLQNDGPAIAVLPASETYNHAPMLAYWNGKFYLEYLSNPFGEHLPPGQTLVATSSDGRNWDKPKQAFPI